MFTQDATLNADRLEVEKSGEVVRFIGGVVMNLNGVGKATTAGGGERDERAAAIARPMRRRRRCCWRCAIAAAAARRQRSPAPAGNAPNALQGFQQNRGQPVQIEAARLEVRDKDKVATFSGNVKVVQGDTTMRCKTLVVFYEQQNKDGQRRRPAAQAMKAATPGPGGSSQISRLEASGGVIVTRRIRPPPATRGLFDMKANTVTLLGNVRGQPGPERHARRAAGGRPDHRRVAGRGRQRARSAC